MQTKLALLTGNTWEALQCVRLNEKDPSGAFYPFRVMTLARPKLFELIVINVGIYGGT